MLVDGLRGLLAWRCSRSELGMEFVQICQQPLAASCMVPGQDHEGVLDGLATHVAVQGDVELGKPGQLPLRKIGGLAELGLDHGHLRSVPWPHSEIQSVLELRPTLRPNHLVRRSGVDIDERWVWQPLAQDALCLFHTWQVLVDLRVEVGDASLFRRAEAGHQLRQLEASGLHLDDVQPHEHTQELLVLLLCARSGVSAEHCRQTTALHLHRGLAGLQKAGGTVHRVLQSLRQRLQPELQPKHLLLDLAWHMQLAGSPGMKL
mmetsp:Transcript_66432/g.154389  ORF Transcript_66432/g.154389 Transcript_66432/m.154389 type:complete len:262 (-) Transcript_66432:148-933(-)